MTFKEASMKSKNGKLTEHNDSKIHYKPLYGLFLIMNIATPYLTGPFIMANEKRLTQWGWLPHYKPALKQESFNKL